MPVPNSGRAEREGLALIRKLQADLRRFQCVPPHRREAECGDAGEQTCRALLSDLGAPGYMQRKEMSGDIEMLSLDEFLKEP